MAVGEVREHCFLRCLDLDLDTSAGALVLTSHASPLCRHAPFVWFRRETTKLLASRLVLSGRQQALQVSLKEDGGSAVSIRLGHTMGGETRRMRGTDFGQEGPGKASVTIL